MMSVRVICLLAGWLAAAAAWGADGDRLTLLNGKSATATITGIDAAGKLTGSGFTTPLDLQALRQVQRDVKVDARGKALGEVHLHGGGVLLVESAKLGEDSLTLRWKYGESVKLPAEIVRAVKLAAVEGSKTRPADTPQGQEAFAAALAKPQRDKDQLLALAEGKVQSLVGLLQQWTADGVEFDWEGQVRSISWDRVYGVVLAQVADPPDTAGECLVKLRDGSLVGGRVQSLADGKLTLLVAAKVTLTLPWSDVTGLAVQSDRLVFLSDVKPVDVRQRPIVTFPQSWQADKNVSGGTLQIGERKFDKGIGVHARCELVFTQGPKFDTLAATIGIDAQAKGRGDCEFVVLGDGQELLRQRMRGSDAAKEIQVATAGYQRITLLVDPGADLDLADHANWCEVRLLRTKDATTKENTAKENTAKENGTTENAKNSK